VNFRIILCKFFFYKNSQLINGGIEIKNVANKGKRGEV
jgi:hypothetical protein